MSSLVSSADVYTDFGGFGKLRAEAARQSPEALKEVAQQFEALFIQMMLKSMRDAKLADTLFDSDQSGMYQDLHDSQLALGLTKGEGIGLAEMLVRQLQGMQSPEIQTQGRQPRNDGKSESGKPVFGKAADFLSGVSGVAGGPNTRTDTRFGAGAEIQIPSITTIMTTTSPGEFQIAGTNSGPVNEKPGVVESDILELEPLVLQPPKIQQSAQLDITESPEAFVRELWPLAERAGKQLGVAPEVLLAQAALETGWGRGVARHQDGRASNNLFNIKADSRWQGESVTVATLEYEQGLPSRQFASFRSYESYQASFDDYVHFISESPRYQQALSVAENPLEYPRELQRAGYATDPEYSNKINNIIDSKPLSDAVSSLKVSLAEPLF